MPNGGVLASCFVCKWAKKDQTYGDQRMLTRPIECLQHGFSVSMPMNHVCADLGDPYGNSGLSTFAESAGLKKGFMYAWFEYMYQIRESPGLPMVYHECLKLAYLSEFSDWTLEQKEKAFRRASREWEPELIHSSQAARVTYDRLSRWYDWLAGSEMILNRQGLDMLDINSGQTVLEIGYGTGQILSYLAGLVGAEGQVAGIDLSAGMARAAGARLSKSGQASRVLRGLGEASQLPFLAGCFDAVIMTFTLESFSTQTIFKVLEEVRRVLRAGGRLGVVALCLPDTPGRMARVYEWFHHTWPELIDCHPINVNELMRLSGFKIARMEMKKMWGLPVELVCGVA